MLALNGVRFLIGDSERRVRFTYAALMSLHDQWGEGFEKRVADAIIDRKLPDLIEIVRFATMDDGLQPLDREAVMQAMPPIIPLCSALEIAWAYAYNGFEAARRFAEVVKREQEERERAATPAKKRLLSRFTFRFGMPTRTRSGAA